MGENGLKAEITLQGTADFYQLDLPEETQRYVLKIVVAKLILSAPEQYGFGLDASQLYPPIQTDAVQLSVGQKVPLQLIAQAAQTSFKTIKDLNPELRGYYLREGDRTLAVPTGAAAGFQERFTQFVQAWEHKTRTSVYTVQAGDSLSSIARNAGVPVRALLVWNEIPLSHSIHPGDTLIVYAPGNG
jgi:LysM repeat protein